MYFDYARWYTVNMETLDSLVPQHTSQPIVDAIKRGEDIFFDGDSSARNGVLKIEGIYYRFAGRFTGVTYDFFLASGNVLASYLRGEKVPATHMRMYSENLKKYRDDILKAQRDQLIRPVKPQRKNLVRFRVSDDELRSLYAAVSNTTEQNVDIYIRSKLFS